MKYLILIFLSYGALALDLSPGIKKYQFHTVYENGGETKFHRITKNETAIRKLQIEVQDLKSMILDLKKRSLKNDEKK